MPQNCEGSMGFFRQLKTASGTCIRLWLGVALGVGVVPMGCVVYSPAVGDEDGAVYGFEDDASVPSRQLDASAWPARKTDELASIVQNTPPEIRWWKVGEGADPAFARESNDPIGLVEHTGLYGCGLIRCLRLPDDTQRNPQRGFAPIRFVSYSLLTDRPMDQRIKRFKRSLERPRRSNVDHVQINDPKVLSMMWEGTGISLVPPAKGVPVRGTIVHMPGLGSMQYEQPVLDLLTQRGWWILRISTPRFWWFEDTKFKIETQADINPAAQRLAAIVDDILAEPAYAAEAALKYLESQRSEVPQSPLMMLGCSAGALMMPTVAARLGDRVDGVVLVGGGANLLKISQESDLTDGGLRIQWPDESDRPAWRKQLLSEYLEHSRLDPYHTAPVLRGKPVLAVLADMDSTVPASCGRLLWERLGKPERYTHPLGHAFLFLTLSGQATRIADWFDAHASAKPVAQSLR